MNVLEFDEHTGAHKMASENVVRKYLVSNGWKYTSRHPGSIWLWTLDKHRQHSDDDGAVHNITETYAVQESVALQIQRYWELEKQHFVAHDAECAIFGPPFNWDDCNCIVLEIEAGTRDADGVPIEDDLAALDSEIIEDPAQP